MPPRDQNRPGLVYGPVRRSGPPDRGRMLGNLVGFLVVIITIVILGAGAWIFSQSLIAPPTDQPPSVAPSIATPSPAPTASMAPGATLESLPMTLSRPSRRAIELVLRPGVSGQASARYAHQRLAGDRT